MSDDQARADIALIRTALDQGRAYATARSPALMVWGLVIAVGYLGTWAFVTGYSTLRPDRVWDAMLALGWIFMLGCLPRRLAGQSPPPPRRPLVVALVSLWFGLGIFLTLTYVASRFMGDVRGDWIEVVSAGVFGVGFFASAPLCNLAWMRLVAIAWWLGELAVLWLQGTQAVLLLCAALYILLLAGPGLALRLRPHAA